jgi:hypothetical protein
LIWFLGCGSPPKTVITAKEESNATTIISDKVIDASEIVNEIPLPKGAVLGDYKGDALPFYAEIPKVDLKNRRTYVSFISDCPQIVIPETVGGTVSSLSLEGFDRDLLLVTAKLKDPNFNKYFLYILRNNEWKPVINGFAIHKSNLNQISQPLQINPDKPNEIVRYYSVFDLDKDSPLGYTWRLLHESIAVENW